MLRAVVLISALASAQEIKIDRDDVEITSSAVVSTGKYSVKDANDNGILVIRGNDITVDFRGATLNGSPEGVDADKFSGWGIIIRGKNITLKNAVVCGFKIGIYAESSSGVTLEGCDVSRNWRQHLHSTPEREAGEDWLFGHHNDENEWFRYGAGIYLDRCDNATVKNCRARNGQNGLCLVRCNEGAFYDNDFSFMSGWGLAMYRSSRNDISNNKLDWCMRGFSYKVYHRGQDSTGILVYEQCSDNVFAYNSATHGGDGFFLWCGDETLNKTGEGGCNRNLLYKNDFSHAAANGIEATFSDGNMFIENILQECDHGIWGGYSYNTTIVGNLIKDCNNGISIEHGHGNYIEGNRFEKNGSAINLWYNPNPEFEKTPYGQKQNIMSENYTVVRNTFSGDRRAIYLEKTNDVLAEENEFKGTAVSVEAAGKFKRVIIKNNNMSGEARGTIETSDNWPYNLKSRVKPGAIKYQAKIPKTRGSANAFLPKDALRGWKYIFVDEWGPYDFTALKVSPGYITGSSAMILGPGGEFKIESVSDGLEVEPISGKLPALVKISASNSGEYTFTVLSGKERVTARGFSIHAKWNVKFFSWVIDPRKDDKAWKAGTPVHEAEFDRIDFADDFDGELNKVPTDHFATLATTDIELPAGKYEFSTISDDGVRLWLDDKKVIDNWTWHGPTEDSATADLTAGKHSIRIEHFDLDGFAQLKFTIRPKK